MPNRYLGNIGGLEIHHWGHTFVLSQTLFIVDTCALSPAHLILRKMGLFCSTYCRVQETAGPVEWLESKAKAFGPPFLNLGLESSQGPSGKGLKIRSSEQKRGNWGGEAQSTAPSSRKQCWRYSFSMWPLLINFHCDSPRHPPTSSLQVL